MQQLIIFTSSFFDFANNKIKIGGLETYIYNLAKLSSENNYETIVYQIVDTQASPCNYHNFSIIPILLKVNYQVTFDDLYNKHNSEKAVFILSTDQLSVKSSKSNVIAIQHGVAFDIPGEMITGFFGKTRFLQQFNKIARCIRNLCRFNYVNNTVCVDYNYFNWYRTIGTIYNDHKLTVIPNYCSTYIEKEQLLNKLSGFRQKKSIIFARRFVDYRGTRIFINAIDRILSTRNDIEVTFAGTGPMLNEIKQLSAKHNCIHIIKFNAEDSVIFHSKYDIAVVPTIYSEGTSLSLCEAMAAGCFPIATYVGGMTNMVLDGYNGKLCYPSEDALFNAIQEVLSMPAEKYRQIVVNAYQSVIASFSLDVWKRKWIKVIEDVFI